MYDYYFEVELKDMPDVDFLSAIDSICKSGKGLYIDNKGLPSEPLPGLIRNTVKELKEAGKIIPAHKKTVVLSLPAYRSDEETREGLKQIREIVGNLDKKLNFEGKTNNNTKEGIKQQLQKIKEGR